MKKMNDEEAANYYENAELEFTGFGEIIEGSKLSAHLPVRFSKKDIYFIKQISSEKGISPSQWLRNLAKDEIQRHVVSKSKGNNSYVKELKVPEDFLGKFETSVGNMENLNQAS